MPRNQYGPVAVFEDSIGNRWDLLQLSYFFLWPLILDADASERKGRLFTTREWFCWAVVAFIIFCGILFSGHR